MKTSTEYSISELTLRAVSDGAYRDRFWKKVTRSDGCWTWNASRCRDGYGTCFIPGKHIVGAHRVAWTIANGLERGAIPEGRSVLHHCDNPACVNPAHLFLGTQLDNVRDMGRKGRARKALGPENANAKLTAETVRHIRRQRAAGVTCRAIAKELGVHPTAVGHVMRGRTWKHVV